MLPKMKKTYLKTLKNYQKIANDEQQRTWLRLHTDQTQFPRTLAENRQRIEPSAEHRLCCGVGSVRSDQWNPRDSKLIWIFPRQSDFLLRRRKMLRKVESKTKELLFSHRYGVIHNTRNQFFACLFHRAVHYHNDG